MKPNIIPFIILLLLTFGFYHCRASLLTGKYPVSTGIYPGVFIPESVGGLSPTKHVTIAKHLQRFGYATAHIGKWHLGVGANGEYLPTKHGFER